MSEPTNDKITKVNFYRGHKDRYNKDTHKDGLYFCTDTPEVLMNEKSYGGGVTTAECSSGNIKLSFANQTVTNVQINDASAKCPGLLTAHDKVKLNHLPTGKEIADDFKEVRANIKNIAEKTGLTKPEDDEGEYGIPESEEKDKIIKDAHSVFDAVEKLDKFVSEDCVHWTKEPTEPEDGQKKHIDLPKTSQLRGTINNKQKDASPQTKEVQLAGISTVNVGYFTKNGEPKLPTMEQSELGNTDIHSELKSNDRPTVEVIETVKKYNGNEKKIIANAIKTGIMPMVSDDVMQIQTDTLSTTQEHYHKHVAYSQDELWYGVRFDMGKNNGFYDGVRTGNLDMHRELPIQSKMRGCVINDKDDTIKYLDPTDWKKFADGTSVSDPSDSHYNFFVEIPEHYRLFLQTPDNNIEIRISEYNLPGYTHVEKKYIGAYEATTDPAYSKDESEETQQQTTNLKYKVLWSRPDWQKPVHTMSRQDMQKAARKSPDIVSENNRTNHWNMYTYDAHTDMTWLFVVEYATLYSQKDFNKELTPEGYHQGGLGAGVTKGYDTNNNTYAWVPCGVTHKLGSSTGIAIYQKDSTGATSVTTPDKSDNTNDFQGDNGNATKTEVPRYRGIENPFGHVWKNTVDVIVVGDHSKPHDVYICRDWTKFTDNVSGTITSPAAQAAVTMLVASGGQNPPAGYDLQPFKECPKVGYVKELVGTNWGDLIPKECTGGVTKYYTDYHWTDTTSGINQAHTLLIGGRSGSEAYAGLFYLGSSRGVSIAHADVGTRLTFYGEPKDEEAAKAKLVAYAMQPKYKDPFDDEEVPDVSTLKPIISVPRAEELIPDSHVESSQDNQDLSQKQPDGQPEVSHDEEQSKIPAGGQQVVEPLDEKQTSPKEDEVESGQSKSPDEGQDGTPKAEDSESEQSEPQQGKAPEAAQPEPQQGQSEPQQSDQDKSPEPQQAVNQDSLAEEHESSGKGQVATPAEGQAEPSDQKETPTKEVTDQESPQEQVKTPETGQVETPAKDQPEPQQDVNKDAPKEQADGEGQPDPLPEGEQAEGE